MSAQARWTVVSQLPRTQITADGRAVKGMMVSFTIAGTNDLGEVFVPGDQPEPELARQMIREYVDRHGAVADLSS